MHEVVYDIAGIPLRALEEKKRARARSLSFPALSRGSVRYRWKYLTWPACTTLLSAQRALAYYNISGEKKKIVTSAGIETMRLFNKVKLLELYQINEIREW